MIDPHLEYHLLFWSLYFKEDIKREKGVKESTRRYCVSKTKITKPLQCERWKPKGHFLALSLRALPRMNWCLLALSCSANTKRQPWTIKGVRLAWIKKMRLCCRLLHLLHWQVDSLPLSHLGNQSSEPIPQTRQPRVPPMGPGSWEVGVVMAGSTFPLEWGSRNQNSLWFPLLQGGHGDRSGGGDQSPIYPTFQPLLPVLLMERTDSGLSSPARGSDLP